MVYIWLFITTSKTRSGFGYQNRKIKTVSNKFQNDDYSFSQVSRIFFKFKLAGTKNNAEPF